jgi:hypothetical protein
MHHLKAATRRRATVAALLIAAHVGPGHDAAAGPASATNANQATITFPIPSPAKRATLTDDSAPSTFT